MSRLRDEHQAPPSWLTARPMAHRGLHDATNNVIENTLAAAEAAIAGGYAIECDVSLTQDAEAAVFHDDTLDRLTMAQGRIGRRMMAELETIAFRAGDARIPSLRGFLAKIAGRTPVVIEIKSGFDGDFRLAARTLEILSSYEGPAALKSFDPLIVAFLRARRSGRPVGLIAQAQYEADEWPQLSPRQRVSLAALADFAHAQPAFLSWCAADLPHAAPQLCRSALGLPVMVWTVRSQAERKRVAPWADQIVFEGFAP